MPRYFATITKEELKKKIIDAWKEHRDYVAGKSTFGGDPDVKIIKCIRYSWRTLTQQIAKDFMQQFQLMDYKKF